MQVSEVPTGISGANFYMILCGQFLFHVLTTGKRNSDIITIF